MGVLRVNAGVLAALLVVLGVGAVVAGVVVLAGAGWGLVMGGVAAAVAGLLIDFTKVVRR